MRRFIGLCSLAILAAALGVSVQAAEKKNSVVAFGSLNAPTEVQARVQAANWLKEAGAYETKKKEFNDLWSQKDVPILDKVAGTFALGDAEAAKLMAQARDADGAAPTTLPAILKDTKKSTFFRANLALAYAKALSNRRVYEEALETLKTFKPEQVVDPSGFLFHKAVAEHGLMLKSNANETIARLLDDVPSAPERYKMVAALMHFDMLTWNERTIMEKLGDIGRKMDNVQRRLDLARGGKKTQGQQKEIVRRLDELIKEIENLAGGS